MPIAFITGASFGIGKASAERLAQEGYDLILAARNTEKLAALAQEIQATHGVRVKPLTMDVSRKDEVRKAVGSLQDGWEKVEVLVNNAGLALQRDLLFEGNPDHFDTMIDTNIKGLLYCTREIVPLILKQPFGHVVNIGSIAGDQGYPGGGVYCATKSAVETITDALRIELLKTNIRVTNLKPGLTRTHFSETRFEGDKTRAAAAYQGIVPLEAEDIADALAYVLRAPKHVQITSLTIVPTHQADVLHTHKTL